MVQPLRRAIVNTWRSQRCTNPITDLSFSAVSSGKCWLLGTACADIDFHKGLWTVVSSYSQLLLKGIGHISYVLVTK